MKDVDTGYKLIALVTVAIAIYSCNSTAVPQGNAAGGIVALRESIDQLQSEVAALTQKVDALSTGCSTSDFLDGKCAQGRLPDGASVTTTYCRGQGGALQLGIGYGVTASAEAKLGAGWPEVLWGELTGKVNFPAAVPVGQVPVPLPTSLSGSGSASLGRNLNLCVSVPIKPTAAQVAQIQDLVRGVNESDGKYARRANRLLNYAARRTPVAVASKSAPGALKPVYAATATATTSPESDDAFDVADNAMEEFMNNGFQPPTQAAGILGDPIFQDLASSLDLPVQLRDEIANPQQVFDAIRKVTISDVCSTYRVDAVLRSGHPEMDKLCSQIEGLPSNYTDVTWLGRRLSTVYGRVTHMYTAAQTKNFICDNVSLALHVIIGDCKGY